MIPITKTKFFAVVEKKNTNKGNLYPNIINFLEEKPLPETVRTIEMRTLLKKEDFLKEDADSYVKIMSFLNSQYRLQGVLFEEPQQNVLEKLAKRLYKKDTRPIFSFDTHIIVIQEIKYKK